MAKAGAWRHTHPERAKAIQARFRERHRERLRVTGRLRRHGLTSEQFDAIRRQQGDRCGACGDPLRPGFRTHIDHDHATGVVRGLLCFDCNLVLGHVRDDISRLEGAIAYLKRSASGTAIKEGTNG